MRLVAVIHAGLDVILPQSTAPAVTPVNPAPLPENEPALTLPAKLELPAKLFPTGFSFWRMEPHSLSLRPAPSVLMPTMFRPAANGAVPMTPSLVWAEPFVNRRALLTS